MDDSLEIVSWEAEVVVIPKAIGIDEPDSVLESVEDLITCQTEDIRVILMAAKSWREAKEIADRKGEELVFHNYDTKEYGACSRDKTFGCFVKGEFVEQRCICMPAKFSPEELEKKERDFLKENPAWNETD